MPKLRNRIMLILLVIVVLVAVLRDYASGEIWPPFVPTPTPTRTTTTTATITTTTMITAAAAACRSSRTSCGATTSWPSATGAGSRAAACWR